ncbi:MAG: 2-amino-4-hydroxy-6-hydroxymethyldihydropteridine diphosphokinase [Bacteroidales bacterium]|jgi:2-amino-4-hydroxy-6-hydroxymethyldihydropteridine diphosphokinase|nr:2-amino-4-hydroxy-6-hydroxymethyldihydropteridine diphosphokinase [Bacteroidales bacterium]
MGTDFYRYYFLGGSNLGDRRKLLQDAFYDVTSAILPGGEYSSYHRKKVSVSGIRETEPWGFSSNDKFLNMAFSSISFKEPEEVLGICKNVENILGRCGEELKFDENGKRVYSSRKIDIDILYVEKLRVEADGTEFREPLRINSVDLTIPHPRLNERLFALEPLCELDGNLTDPVSCKSFREIVTNLKNN